MAENNDHSDQLPLKGVVLCCTSIAQDVRNKLADVATQMGALHKLDLTSDVTHLLVGDIATPKYRYVAKERPDICALLPEFIEAVRSSWMEGGDVEVDALEREFTLSPFSGLQVCLTGVDDPRSRKEMEDTIIAKGGVYHGDLTKAVTHLVCAKPEGAKYTHAKQWGIHVVGLKWYEDCLVRGMAVDESYYLPELPIEQQGVGAFRKLPKRILGKRSREVAQSAGIEGAGQRKLRKVTSQRLDSQSQDMWRNISANKVQVETTELDAWNDESQTLREESTLQTTRKPETPAVDDRAAEEQRGLFSGHYVLIHGFDAMKAKKLRQFLEPNGATVVESTAELEAASENLYFHNRCLLMPHAAPTKIPDVPPGTILVTEWWVERCIHYKHHLDPEHDSLSSPLADALVSGFANLTISTTGFGGVDLRQTAEAVKLMGAAYQENLLPSTSVLVCGSAVVKKEKAFYASKHGIPVVSADWLWASLKSKRKASMDQYKIALPAFDPNELVGEPSTSSPAPSDSLPFQRSGEARLRADDLLHPKRLSATRNKHATPSLLLKPSRPSGPRRPKPSGPFIHQDEDEDEDDAPAPLSLEPMQPALTAPDPSPDAAQTLREISPNTSHLRSEAGFQSVGPSLKDDNADAAVTKKPLSVIELVSPESEPPKSPKSPQPRPSKENAQQQPKLMQELTSDLAGILARRVATAPSSAIPTEPQKRKYRRLGRNLSGISNQSHSTSASPALLSEIPESMSAADGFSTREAPALPPSTQLGYDTPDAEAHRLQMSKKMGLGALQEESSGTRVPSMGTVKDSEEIAARANMAGMGNRSKTTRTRTKT